MTFDHATSGDFTLIFRPDITISAPTEIFLPPYRYPNGYDVDVDSSLAWKVCDGFANKICVFASTRAVDDAKAFSKGQAKVVVRRKMSKDSLA